jgi:hypothetical protein
VIRQDEVDEQKRRLELLGELRLAIKAFYRHGKPLAFTGAEWREFHNALVFAEEAGRYFIADAEEVLLMQDLQPGFVMPEVKA